MALGPTLLRHFSSAHVDKGAVAMLVGVPKEIKDHEYRVGLIPSTVGNSQAKVIVSWSRRAQVMAPELVTTITWQPAPRS